MCDRLLGAAKCHKRVAEIVACFGIGRPNHKRLLIMGDRLLNSAKRLQSVAQIVVSLGEIRSNRERLFVALDGLLDPAESYQGNSEVMVCFRRVPIYIDRPPKQPGGIVEFALLEVKQAQVIERAEI